MLKKFKVKNYKGFKEEIVFDFADVRRYTFNEYAIKDKLINSAIIYGKNGSGKSNLGLALFDLIVHLTDLAAINQQATNYLNGDSDEEHASFTYEFQIADFNYIYSYKKTDVENLIYEELYINDEKIFSYNFETFKGDLEGLKVIGAESLNVSRLRNISLLKFIANNTNLEEDNPITKLMDFVSGMLWYRSAVDGNNYIGLTTGSDLLTISIIKANKVEDFEKFLYDKGINYNLHVSKSVTNEDILVANFKNRLFKFTDVASHGTKVLMLYYHWKLYFQKATFVFIDEFDAFFHTELGEKLIKELSKEQTLQLVITTHNTNLMSNNILRPDSYFIVSNNKITSLPNATLRELREGHNLKKLYLSGAFNEIWNNFIYCWRR